MPLREGHERKKKMRLLAKESHDFIGEPNIFECHDSNWTIAHVNSNYVKALSNQNISNISSTKKGGISKLQLHQRSMQ
jgi:hypothetical protein